MHEDDFEHEHYSYGSATDQALAMGDLVQLTTVGIDVGSSTSHLMFSRLHLARQGVRLSSRYVVVLREVLHRSEIMLTPYLPDNTIDATKLADFVHSSYKEAGLNPEGIDSGAIILTGEAIKRHNAQAIAEHVAGESGQFVCATAGHNFEAVLSAHGSGAVALSREKHQTLLNVDIGGGTTKLALIQHGDILETAALNVGGRLIALEEHGKLARIEPAGRLIADALGIDLQLGVQPTPQSLEQIAMKMADVLVEVVRAVGGHHDSPQPVQPVGQQNHSETAGGSLGPPSALLEKLLLTQPLSSPHHVDAITFSGGVSEYLYRRETRSFGDLAQLLAVAVDLRVAAGFFPAPIAQASERLRATVIGASQFTVQVSGSTIAINQPSLLPIRNLPVIYPRLAGDDASARGLAAAIERAHLRLDLTPGAQDVALAIPWQGVPHYASLRHLAEGIVHGMRPSLDAGRPLILVFNSDIGNLVGQILHTDLGLPNNVISIDNIELDEFDFIDIGQIIQPAGAVPVVVKSLVFPALKGPQGEVL